MAPSLTLSAFPVASQHKAERSGVLVDRRRCTQEGGKVIGLQLILEQCDQITSLPPLHDVFGTLSARGNTLSGSWRGAPATITPYCIPHKRLEMPTAHL